MSGMESNCEESMLSTVVVVEGIVGALLCALPTGSRYGTRVERI